MGRKAKSTKLEVGERFFNKFGSYQVVSYESARKVQIRWDKTGHEIFAQAHDVADGRVKDPLFPSIFGVGYFGIGPHLSTKGGKVLRPYYTWKAMLQRCYDTKSRHRWQSYEGCEVCVDWHNFQTFADWFVVNYVDGFQLDKDILVKNNNIYSPETCRFVPERINRVMIRNKSSRAMGSLPIGVSLHQKVTPRYYVHCSDVDSKQKFLGSFSTPEEAFFVYKNFKEGVIKSLADEYKASLPEDVYIALINYQVEEDD